MSHHKKHIIAVGGGFASVKLALELANDPNFNVTLIAPHDQLEYHGALYRSATGRSPMEVIVPFHEIFADAGNVTCVNDFVTDLRPQTKEVVGQSGRAYTYDALVLGLGYEVAYFGIAGMREHAETLYTIFDTIKLRNRLRDSFIHHAGRQCQIAISGAGPNGVELAGDINTLAGIVAEQYGTKVCTPRITLIDMADRVLPVLKPEVSEAATARLKELGISVKLKAAVKRASAKKLHFADGSGLDADVIIWTAGSHANPFFSRFPGLFNLDPRGRVFVGEYLQANSPDIYVLGDSASTQYSGLAQTAITDARQLAANFKRFVNHEDLIPYAPQAPLYAVPIGPDWAIAEQHGQMITGSEAWDIRRKADRYILGEFLSDHLADAHWERALQTAQV